MVISSIEPERFVLVDECSSNTKYAYIMAHYAKDNKA